MSNDKTNKTSQKQRKFYSLHPWECTHFSDRTEISAYVEASGEWEVTAIVKPTSGASAEALATFIVKILNEHQRNKNLLLDAMDALELILEEDGLTFASEQAADAVIKRYKSSSK